MNYLVDVLYIVAFGLFILGLSGLTGPKTAVRGNWIADFRYLKSLTDWGILNYTFHPFVIGRGHRMMVLDKLLKTLADEGATFMAMEDAADLYDKTHPYTA